MKKYQSHWREWNEEKQRECGRKSYRKNREKRLLDAKKWQQKLKVEVFTHYCNGKPKCKCCKEQVIEFLSLDHIGGKGLEKRKKVGSSYRYYAYLKRNNYPKGYRVLCHNCNQATSWGRVCPHELIKETI